MADRCILNILQETPPAPTANFYHLANLDTVLRRYPIDGGGDMGVSDASIDLVAYLSPASGHDVTLFTDGTDIYVFQEKDAYNSTVLVKVDKALTTVSASRSNVQGADPIGVCPSGFLVRNGLVSNLDVLHPTTLADVSSERIDFSGNGRAPNVNGVKCTQAMMDVNPWIGLFSSPTYWYAPVDVNTIGGVGYDCDELSAWDYSAYAENNIGMPDNSTVVTRTGVVINRNTGAIIHSFTPYSLLSTFTPWQEYNGVDLYKVGYGGALRRLADYKNSAGGDGNYNVVSGITMASEIDAILIA